MAEQALATARLCFLMFPEEPVRAPGRAAASSGDSIAAPAGAFAGARHGIGGFPVGWAKWIEYADRLARAGAAWD